MSKRVIIVTGGLGTLGQAVARKAIEKGADVALVDYANGTAAPGGTMVIGNVDLTQAQAAEYVVTAVRNRFGRVDAVCNVAGAFRWTTLAESDPGLWELLFRTNVQTAANMCRAATPALIASANGRIVNVGAAGAERAGAGMGAYAASKAGVHKLTESLAEELKDSGVRVNAVLPTIIDTPQNRQDMPDADFTRWVSPDELAEIILFLASVEAAALNGALVRVAGRT